MFVMLTIFVSSFKVSLGFYEVWLFETVHGDVVGQLWHLLHVVVGHQLTILSSFLQLFSEFLVRLLKMVGGCSVRLFLFILRLHYYKIIETHSRSVPEVTDGIAPIGCSTSNRFWNFVSFMRPWLIYLEFLPLFLYCFLQLLVVFLFRIPDQLYFQEFFFQVL